MAEKEKPPAVASVEVKVPVERLRIGQTVKLTARVVDEHGDEVRRNPGDIRWLPLSGVYASMRQDGTLVAHGNAKEDQSVKVQAIDVNSGVVGEATVIVLAAKGPRVFQQAAPISDEVTDVPDHQQ